MDYRTRTDPKLLKCVGPRVSSIERSDGPWIISLQVAGMNEAVIGCGDQSMKQLFATYPELEEGLLIGSVDG